MHDNGLLSKIIQWADVRDNVRALILSGSLAGKGRRDELSDYDIAVYGNEFSFIADDKWLQEIDDFWLCIHDEFNVNDAVIPTRLTIFNDFLKVDFSFHPMELLENIEKTGRLPDGYDIGYEILLDKDGYERKLPIPTYKGFLINKPNVQEFQNNSNEFFFEIYHT